VRSRVLVRVSTVSNSIEGLLRGQLRYLNQFYKVIAVSSGKSVLEKVSVEEGIEVAEVSMKRPPHALKDLLSLVRLCRVLFSLNPYIVHSITPKAGLLAMLASWLIRVPYRIHTFTGLLFPTATGLKKIILMWCDKCICFFATNIIAESKGVKLELEKITSKHISVIGDGHVNGINTELFNPNLIDLKQEAEILRRQFKIKPNDLIFLYIGRLVNDKGLRELIQAFQSVSENFENVHLIVVGGKEHEHDAISDVFFNIICSHPRIHYLGVCRDVRVYHLLSDYLVLPSYREGFPNVVLQSLSMGVPCIVTEVFGATELVVENVNGFFIDKKSIDSISRIMLRILKGEVGIKKSLDYRSTIVSKFRNEIVWENNLKYYSELSKSN
jgi:glycosyltransferase involved in cell wall biosynthesis